MFQFETESQVQHNMVQLFFKRYFLIPHPMITIFLEKYPVFLAIRRIAALFFVCWREDQKTRKYTLNIMLSMICPFPKR